MPVKKFFFEKSKILFIVLVFLLLQNIVCYLLTASVVLSQAKKNLCDNSSLYGQKISSWASRHIGQFDIYKRYLEKALSNGFSLKETMDEIQLTFPVDSEYPNGIFVGSESGIYYNTSGWKGGSDYFPKERSWFVQTIGRNGFVFGKPYVDFQTSRRCVSLSGRLNIASEMTVMAVDVFLDYPDRFVKNMRIEENLDYVNVLTADSFELVSCSSSLSDDFTGVLLDQIRLLERSDSFLKEIAFEGQKFFVMANHIPETDWLLVSCVRKSSFLWNQRKVFILIVLMELLLFMCISFVIFRVQSQVDSYFKESLLDRRVISSVVQNYIACAYIDIQEDSYRIIRLSDRITDYIDIFGNATNALDHAVRKFIDSIHFTRMMDFCRLDTLEKRFGNKRSVYVEFLGSRGSWCRAGFVLVDHDDAGKIKHVLFTVQRIDGEIVTLRERLHIEETLVECIRTFSSRNDFDVSINRLLEIIGGYYKSDRSYIFEINNKEGTCSNTYEWCRKGVVPQIDRLQNVPVSVIDRWISLFKQKGKVIISNRNGELDPDSDESKLLAVQEIGSLAAVPILSQSGEIQGFIGIDNTTENMESDVLLTSISAFISEEMLKKTYTSMLYDLSFKDTMTGLFNRHAFIRDIEEIVKKNESGIGVIFADVNGLKRTNDLYGHKAGDELILSASKILKNFFGNDFVYRIGGDEFVVFIKDISENKFSVLVDGLLKTLGERCIISVGEVWVKHGQNIEHDIKIADSKMYQRKNQFYISSGMDRRQS